MPFADINSKRVFYTIASPDSNTPSTGFTLLCIHGLGSASSFYHPITPYLTSLGHTVLAADTHGAGLSLYTGSGNSTLTIRDDVLELLDKLEGSYPKNVIVLGHSMGGIVASEIALKDQDRIKAVVLIGPVNPNPGAAEVFAKRVEIVASGIFRSPPASFKSYCRLIHIQGGMEPLALTIPVGATGASASLLAQSFIRQLLLQNNPDAYISHCKAIQGARVPDYASIKAPMLLIAGDEDKSAPIVACDAILEGYGSVKKEMRILSGVGHWHCLEAFEDVGKAVAEFIADL